MTVIVRPAQSQRLANCLCTCIAINYFTLMALTERNCQSVNYNMYTTYVLVTGLTILDITTTVLSRLI